MRLVLAVAISLSSPPAVYMSGRPLHLTITSHSQRVYKEVGMPGRLPGLCTTAIDCDAVLCSCSFTTKPEVSFTGGLFSDREPQDYDNDAIVVHMGCFNVPDAYKDEHTGGYAATCCVKTDTRSCALYQYLEVINLP